MRKQTERDVARLMNEIDVDGDGDISIDEFAVWWEENGSDRYKPQPPPVCDTHIALRFPLKMWRPMWHFPAVLTRKLSEVRSDTGAR